jgi:vacuolar-type H+-ATPase subunit D/Vma8
MERQRNLGKERVASGHQVLINPLAIRQVLQNVPPQANAKVGMRVDNVAGVKIPVFEKVNQEGAKTQDLTGLASGGQKVDASRVTFVSIAQCALKGCTGVASSLRRSESDLFLLWWI